MADRVDIVSATAAHIDALADHVREADKREFWALSRRTPAEVMAEGLRFSSMAWVAFIDGAPSCMFGVAPASILGGVGVPWMVGTDKVERNQFVFLRHCHQCLVMMLDRYTTLYNIVDCRNEVAIRWLRWLGFSFGVATLHGVDQLPFKPFFMYQQKKETSHV